MFSRIVATVCLILTFTAANALAQLTTGSIEGRLFTSAGEPVSFANVTVTGPNLQGARGVMSTTTGYFGVFKLPAGEYTVKIFHVSYHEATIEKVIVYLGRSNALGDIKLEDKIHEAPKVVVIGRKPVIDPTTTITGINILESEFENLPIQRNYREIAGLLPQVNQSPFGDGLNYSGATGIENRYFVDGVEVTDPGLGQTGTNLPYNFMLLTKKF